MKRTPLLVTLVVLAFFARGLSAEDITLVYLQWGGPEEVQIAERLIELFEKEHPGIKVQRIRASAYTEKLKTMMAGGIPPDVMYMSAADFPSYVRKGVLLDFEPYLEENPGIIDLDDFYPQLLDAFRYQGHIYGFPKDFTTFVAYYNQDLFDELGLPYPDENWTWDDMRDYAIRINRLEPGKPKRLGVHYAEWLESIIGWVWMTGGRWADENGRCVFNSPETIRALQYLHDLKWKDEVVPSGATAAGQSPDQLFLTGNLGMYVGYGRWVVPRFRLEASFRWGVAPLPRPCTGDDCVSKGAIATVAYSVSAGSKHPREAFQLASFLAGPKGQALNSELGLAVPALESVANSKAFVNPEIPPADDGVYLDVIENSRVMPFDEYWAEVAEIAGRYLGLTLGINDMSVEEACRKIETEINNMIDLRRRQEAKEYAALNWNYVAVGFFCLIALLLGFAWWRARRGPRVSKLGRYEELWGYFCISPWLIGFTVFTLGPIMVSIVLSFGRWEAITPLSSAKLVVFENYAELFRDPRFYQSLKVTIFYTLGSVPLGLVLGLAVAILMNQKIPGITIFRTVYYLPAVVSGVAVAVLWWWIFNGDIGLLNMALTRIGIDGPDWLGKDGKTWALPAFVIMSLWGVGGGMLIYLAGLQNIPTQLYEAATIDGAGRWRKFIHVTLPMISPILLFNLIMGIIGSFQVFTQSYVMTGGGPADATLFYVLYLYYNAFRFHRMGYASAMAWILFIIVLVCTLLVLKSSSAWVYYEGGKRGKR
jgi:multiple sugar transport system permease protein